MRRSGTRANLPWARGSKPFSYRMYNPAWNGDAVAMQWAFDPEFYQVQKL